MTSEELNRAIEFLTQQAAQFWAGMEEVKLSHQELSREMKELKEQTARFETWAAEVVAIESRRLDEHDRLHRDILRVLNMILDRLLPSND